MTNLIDIPESLTSGFSPIGLDLLSLGAILSGILVITARNPVISVLFLIGLFVNIAGYLILLEINFIGLAYITVYVGAIAILFLFVIFLLDIKLAELHGDNNKNKDSLPLGAIIGVGFLYPLYSIIPKNVIEMKSLSFGIFNLFNSFITNNNNNNKSFSSFKLNDNNKLSNLDIDLALTDLWDGNFAAFTQISSLGNIMYTNYLLWFFISSIILLLAMIGAISLTFKPR